MVQSSIMSTTASNGTDHTTHGQPREQRPLTHLAVARLEALRRTDRLPDHIYEKAALCIIDYLGAVISGLTAPWAPALLQYAQRTSSKAGPGEAWAIGLDGGVSAELAAFTNAAVGHSMIRDDMHVASSSHIGVIVVPATLALAQREGWTGEQLLRSLVGGYEMGVVLGSAVRHEGRHNPHFRPSGILGAFAVAGAGIVADRDMDASTAASALSFAVNAAAGLNQWAWAGGNEINTEMGTASRNGIVALDLARAGLYSSDTVLEGKDGLFAAYGSGTIGVDKFRDWLLVETNSDKDLGAGISSVNFKPVAGCNFIQTPLSVALRLSGRVTGSVQQVERVVITTTAAAKAYPGCNSAGPFDKVGQTKMSIQFGVSAALLFGRIDEAGYTQYDDASLRDLVQKCSVVADPGYDGAFATGRQPCRIEIEMRDGTRHAESLEDVPWLDAEAVRKRFEQEAASIYETETVAQLIEECLQLRTAQDSTRLFELLRSMKKTS